MAVTCPTFVPSERRDAVSLDLPQSQILPGSLLLIDKRGAAETGGGGLLVRQVETVSERSRADYGISGKVTELVFTLNGSDDPGFRYLLSKGATRRLWIKVSAPYRNGSDGRGLETAGKAIPMLIEHMGVDRLVWGSDWPHTRHESYRSIPVALAELEAWFPNADDRARVAGANALELFKF